MFFYGCHSIHTGVYLEVRFKEDIKKPDDIASNAIDISIIIYRDFGHFLTEAVNGGFYKLYITKLSLFLKDRKCLFSLIKT